jgi:hypothetical protein
MDVGAEHIRETRAKILAAKREIKEYLRIPEDARGLLILTHGKCNVIFLNQTCIKTKNIPKEKPVTVLFYTLVYKFSLPLSCTRKSNKL